jgi:hypothetical protein
VPDSDISGSSETRISLPSCRSREPVDISLPDDHSISGSTMPVISVSPVAVSIFSKGTWSIDQVCSASAISSQTSGATISTIGSVDPVRYSSHEAAVTSDTERILTVKNGNNTSATSRAQLMSSERDRIIKYVTKIICKIIQV